MAKPLYRRHLKRTRRRGANRLLARPALRLGGSAELLEQRILLAVFDWTPPGANQYYPYENPANWTLANNANVHDVPGPADDADFNMSSSMNLIQDETIRDATFESGQTNVSIPADTRWTVDQTLTVAPASGDTATASFGGGELEATGIVVGDGAGSNGTMQTAETEVIVHTFATIGNSGHGELAVALGEWYLFEPMTIANRFSGTGIVYLSDDGTEFYSDELTVGNAGNGQLTVDQHALLASYGDVFIGNQGTSLGLAEVKNGATWDAKLKLLVGVDGTGRLEISSGGTVTTDGSAVLGVTGTGHGTATIDGAGSAWDIHGPLTIGDAGRGVMNVTAGGHVSDENATIAGPNAVGSSATVDGAGSTWASTGSIVVDQGGTLTITNNGDVNATGGVTNKNGGVINVNGQANMGANLLNQGQLFAGLPTGTGGNFSLSGSYTQSVQGSLTVDVAGPSPGAGFTQTQVAGSAALDGTLTVPAVGSPDFEPGQRYNILTSSGLSGQFSNLVPTDTDGGVRYLDVSGGGSLPSLPSGLEWEVEYSSGGVTLVVVPTVSIESNGDIYESDTSPGSFTVTRTGPITNSLTVSYTTSGSAVSSADYSALSGSVTIPSGSRTANIYVTPQDDGDSDDSQSSETLTATLQRQVGGYALGTPNAADMTISEETPPTVTIAATVANAVEAGSPGQFTVSRTGPTDSSLTVNLSASGTAVAGTNYTGLPASVTIPAGSRTAPLVVNALDDGTPGTGDPETLTETIQPSSSYKVGTPGSANVNIQEEGYTTVTIAATTASTYEGATMPGEFTVTRQAPYNVDLAVNYALSGSAVNGTDYQTLSGTVNPW